MSSILKTFKYHPLRIRECYIFHLKLLTCTVIDHKRAFDKTGLPGLCWQPWCTKLRPLSKSHELTAAVQLSTSCSQIVRHAADGLTTADHWTGTWLTLSLSGWWPSDTVTWQHTTGHVTSRVLVHAGHWSVSSVSVSSVMDDRDYWFRPLSSLCPQT